LPLTYHNNNKKLKKSFQKFSESFLFFFEMRTRDVRILDEPSRKRRNEKWVELLTKDNFQNDKGDAQIQILEQLEKERARRLKERKGRASGNCKYTPIQQKVEKKNTKKVHCKKNRQTSTYGKM